MNLNSNPIHNEQSRKRVLERAWCVVRVLTVEILCRALVVAFKLIVAFEMLYLSTHSHQKQCRKILTRNVCRWIQSNVRTVKISYRNHMQITLIKTPNRLGLTAAFGWPLNRLVNSDNAAKDVLICVRYEP